MNQLKLIIKTEYLNDIKNKSFWIGTFLVPILLVGFGAFVGFMMAESDVSTAAQTVAPADEDMTGPQAMGMLVGIFLALFLMTYGSQIYAKVRKEKVNRIMEVLATCVTGRTMMIAKIISVGLIGLTQIALWAILIVGGVVAVVLLLSPDIPWQLLSDPRVWKALIWALLFFVGGYIFYGSIYAACGAMTDRDNENQGYMTALTFLLLMSFYVAMFAATNSGNVFVQICSYLPFTSPTVGVVGAISGDVPVWQSILQVIVLYAFAWVAVSLSGKIYTSSLLLKGRKFSFKDIAIFLKSK